MTWSSSFYFSSGGGSIVHMPIETVTFEIRDVASFEVEQSVPVFELNGNAPIFDFTGEPVFRPLAERADFNVEC